MRRSVIVTALVILALSLVFLFTATIITDWFWFGEVGYQSVFLTSILSSLGLRLVTALFFFIIIYLNLRVALRSLHIEPETYEGENVVPIRKYVVDRFFDKKKLNILFIAASLLMAFIFSSAASGNWLMVQQFLNKASFGIREPIFNLDASFYVFTLPFLRMLYGVLFTGILLSLFASGAAYFMFGSRDFLNWRDNSVSPPKVHLSVLVALIFLLKAFGYWLDGYGLLNKMGNVVFGPGYTDVHVKLLALKVLTVLAVAGAAVVLINIFLRRFKYVLYTVAALVAVSVLLGGVAPYAVQKVRVEPNELNVEAPFIRNNIDLTRKAFNLDKIQLKSFQADNLDLKDIQENPGTISNIRLWDIKPLKDANTQLQEIRQYYSFLDVDIDRYVIGGELRQVMVSARELSKEQLPQEWVNQKLRYTHGYGLTMNYVASATKEGHPNYIIKDIPPKSDAIEVKVPQIYFGQAEDSYVFVNTNTEEFDYPSTTGNISTTYSGTGGIPISNIFTRALFAFRFGDYRMLISNAITDESKIIFRSNISERVQKIAPFLVYDKDPYLVVDNGRLFWIQDAYTTSNRFPYATPLGGVGNYIRNSVKITIDAYNGDVVFYADTENDPIVKAYSGIFPKLFKSWEEIPDSLRAHLRYPEDLFNIQAEVYKTYHMEDVTDFYNKEDLWTIPQETVDGELSTMEAYYTIMALPGEDSGPEFVLMLPFTPVNKNNMAAWLAVRCDPEHYGETIVFQFSKQELVYGPAQVEAEIQADSEISQAISLWGQRGSEVIKGNLLVIPINDGILYAEPLFLQSEQNKLPSLKRVIVFHNGELAWADTLGQALAKLFGEGEGTEAVQVPEEEGLEEQPGEEGIPSLPDLEELIDRANELFRQAKERQQAGDWAGYGEALAELESVLEQLANQ